MKGEHKRLESIIKASLPLLVAVLVTAVFAVPVIHTMIQQLGAGAGEVLTPVDKAWMNYVFSKNNGNKLVISGIRVMFDKDLPAGSYIRVEIRDSDDNVFASGEKTLGSDLPAHTWTTIDVEPDIDGLGMQNFYKVVVIVAGQEISV